MKELEYPFDSSFLLQKRRKLKKALLADGSARMEKRIAVLGGSTTNDIVSMLELFLLNCGIQPVFYQSEYAQYWQDAMFDAPELAAFQPDLIFIHTTSRNITEAPLPLSASEQEVQDALERQYTHFTQMWEHLAATYHCPILQNNFELPATRLMGNRDGWDCHGMVWFISELNRKFGQYAAAHNDFYIHDIHYLAASYGLDAWHDNSYWYLYKYAMTLDGKIAAYTAGRDSGICLQPDTNHSLHLRQEQKGAGSGPRQHPLGRCHRRRRTRGHLYRAGNR